jgi:hypothetical protein
MNRLLSTIHAEYCGAPFGRVHVVQQAIRALEAALDHLRG